MPVAELSRMTARRLGLLEKLGLKTVEDCLENYPTRYLDRSRMVTLDRVGYASDVVSVEARVVNHVDVPVRRSNAPKVSKAIISDGKGVAALVGFGKRAGYLKRSLKVGDVIVVSGQFRRSPRGQPAVESTTFEYEVLSDDDAELVHTGRLVPVYRLTEGISQRALRSLTSIAVRQYADAYPEPLPTDVRDRLNLIHAGDAIREVHFPSSPGHAEVARRRLVFDEFLGLQLGLLLRRRAAEDGPAGLAHRIDGDSPRRLLSSLPFRLTDAQRRVLDEIEADMSRPKPMNRLLQGDVGSGKTVVAAVAMLHAVESGYQAAMMAPTEILAEQHHDTLRCFLSPIGVEPCLVTGDMSAGDKRAALEAIASGSARVVVGTHALIQSGVEFAHLSLVVTDEQHRFGVLQRDKLRQKGGMPDTLVMTATPIPRTLALTVYGDLAVSVIDELPPGRKPIQTKQFSDEDREQLYRFIEHQLSKDRQAYVVYPLIEESEKLEDVQAASEAAERLAAAFPNRRVALLHGRLSSDERHSTMQRFQQGLVDILVSTTVIEVGVDVPNANIMVIENVERFGLAQLHQLRGRVGRGEHASYCALVGRPRTDEGKRRLAAMLRTTDGFEIAEEDLAIRGPGEILGTRQSGTPTLRIADLIRDADVLEVARCEAESIVASDPSLSSEDHHVLRDQLRRRWRGRLRFAGIG